MFICRVGVYGGAFCSASKTQKAGAQPPSRSMELGETRRTRPLGSKRQQRTTSAVTSNVTGARTSAYPSSAARRFVTPPLHGCPQGAHPALCIPCAILAASGLANGLKFPPLYSLTWEYREYYRGFQGFFRGYISLSGFSHLIVRPPKEKAAERAAASRSARRFVQPPKPTLIEAKGPWKLISAVWRVSIPASIAPKKKSAR